MWAYQQAGISLPHSSQALAQGGQAVSMSEMQPGDLVTYYSDASHVGMYIGDGMMVHASTYGTPVRVVPVTNAPIQTSVGTERPLLGLLLLAELILAVTLLGIVHAGGPPRCTAAPAPLTTPTASLPASSTLSLPDGRTAQFIGLGEHTAPLLTRIGSQIGDAAEAVTAFWGTDWRRDIVIVAAGSDEQFAALAGGGADIAAATTGSGLSSRRVPRQ